MVSKRQGRIRNTRRTRLLREFAAKEVGLDANGALSIERLCKKEGNVFTKLGFLHPEQEYLKALLTAQVCHMIAARNATQKETAAVLGITQQEVSLLKRRHLSKFPVGRLIEFAVILGHDVELVVRPAKGARGLVSLTRPDLSE